MSEDAPMYNLTTGECTASVLATLMEKRRRPVIACGVTKTATLEPRMAQPPGTDKGT
jgi:hypothetical protein